MLSRSAEARPPVRRAGQVPRGGEHGRQFLLQMRQRPQLRDGGEVPRRQREVVFCATTLPVGQEGTLFTIGTSNLICFFFCRQHSSWSLPAVRAFIKLYVSWSRALQVSQEGKDAVLWLNVTGGNLGVSGTAQQ